MVAFMRTLFQRAGRGIALKGVAPSLLLIEDIALLDISLVVLGESVGRRPSSEPEKKHAGNC